MTLSASPTVKKARVALVGNPNVGKTSLFNALTGLSARVGNYPGVTVEQKRGQLALDSQAIEVVDLPGIYALSPFSPDEVVAFSVLTEQAYDLALDGVIVLLDASNLERNLYLFSQLLGLGLPLVAALTMCDVAAEQQIVLDQVRLAERLGVEVVAVNGTRRTGLVELKAAIARMLERATPPTLASPSLGADMDEAVAALQDRMVGRSQAPWPRFLLERALIDEGGYVEGRFARTFGAEGEQILRELRARVPAEPVLAAHEARSRYRWVHEQLADGVLRRPAERVRTLTDRLDALFAHKWLGFVFFALLMTFMFESVYTWSQPVMDLIGQLFKQLGTVVGAHMADGALKSLLVDGVIAGLGTVVTFLPQIVVLFLFIGLLEDCGYMARAAFLMDRVMGKAGLSGKSFIPMLSGFACAVPSIMATRTIENRRDRLATILALPLMSCSARLPVYTIMIGAFVPAARFFGFDLRGIVLLAFYSLGVLFAVPLVFTLKRTLLKGETPTLVMELPSYKLPSLRVVGMRVYQQSWHFLERAGSVIFLVAIVIWAGAYFPHRAAAIQPLAAERAVVSALAKPDPARVSKLEAAEATAYVDDSYLARLGRTIEPAFEPLGWDWRITTSVLASFPARETIVATLGTLYSMGDQDPEGDQTGLMEALKNGKRPDGRPEFTTAIALSVVVFFALCLQCASTLAVMWRETGSWRWPLIAFTSQTSLAYLCAFLTYQLLTRCGL